MREPRQCRVRDQIGAVFVMVVVIDRHADVVQVRRIIEQPGLERTVPVQTLEPFKQTPREQTNLFGVFERLRVMREQILHAERAHIGNQVRVRHEMSPECALAHALPGNLQFLETSLTHHGLVHQRPGQDHIGTVWVDTGNARTVVRLELDHLLDQLLE